MLGQAAGAFLLLGVAVVAGYVGQATFRRFRVSDILVLLFVGFTLGPLLGLLDASWIKPAMPVLAPLGLTIILFEGGLELRWDDLRRHGVGAIGFTLLCWTLTVAAVTLALHGVLGLPWHLAALLGCAVGPTGIVAVIPILAQVSAPAKARVWLTVETGVGDLLSVVGVVSLSTLYLFGGSGIDFAGLLVAKFALGAAVGLLGGLAWARLLHHVHERAHAYGVTLGGLILTSAITEALGGSGYLSALVFGLVVGNAHVLMARGGVPALASLSERSRHQQSEVIFLLRSVYFVYLGMSVGMGILSPASGLAMLALCGTMVAARLLAVAISHRIRAPEDRQTRILLAGMMPRAMATAVTASIPMAMGVPGSEGFLATTLLVIVGCDIATTVALFAYEKKRRATLTGGPAAALSTTLVGR